MTPDTETLLLHAVENMRTEVGALTRQVGELQVQSAREEGLDKGLALNSRLQSVETDMKHRPTTTEIAQMLDNRLKTLAIRVAAAAFCAIPVWMGAGVALAAYLDR